MLLDDTRLCGPFMTKFLCLICLTSVSSALVSSRPPLTSASVPTSALSGHLITTASSTHSLTSVDPLIKTDFVELQAHASHEKLLPTQTGPTPEAIPVHPSPSAGHFLVKTKLSQTVPMSLPSLLPVQTTPSLEVLPVKTEPSGAELPLPSMHRLAGTVIEVLKHPNTPDSINVYSHGGSFQFIGEALQVGTSVMWTPGPGWTDDECMIMTDMGWMTSGWALSIVALSFTSNLCLASFDIIMAPTFVQSVTGEIAKFKSEFKGDLHINTVAMIATGDCVVSNDATVEIDSISVNCNVLTIEQLRGSHRTRLFADSYVHGYMAMTDLDISEGRLQNGGTGVELKQEEEPVMISLAGNGCLEIGIKVPGSSSLFVLSEKPVVIEAGSNISITEQINDASHYIRYDGHGCDSDVVLIGSNNNMKSNVTIPTTDEYLRALNSGGFTSIKMVRRGGMVSYILVGPLVAILIFFLI
eukprot:GHVN01106419.1.p1 GENE.GHVN01106419.1~~GHVN01106419.1.p1  ORF type:complete len:470 (-),score=75.11 GHVN01106419.1:279-1688(-)